MKIVRRPRSAWLTAAVGVLASSAALGHFVHAEAPASFVRRDPASVVHTALRPVIHTLVRVHPQGIHPPATALGGAAARGGIALGGPIPPKRRAAVAAAASAALDGTRIRRRD